MQSLNTSPKNTDLILCRPVGKSEKDVIFLLTLNVREGLTVGRNEYKIPHASERAQAQDFMDENERKRLIQQVEQEQKEQEKIEKFDLQAMRYINNLFKNLKTDVKVCFHNKLYVEQIRVNFPKEENDIFLEFVKMFARFRSFERVELLNNVVITNENDFLQAFRLMKQRKIAEYSNLKQKHINKVLGLLEANFQERTFSASVIAKEFYYNYTFIGKILMYLVLKRKIEFVKELKGMLFYRLREKTPLHVKYR